MAAHPTAFAEDVATRPPSTGGTREPAPTPAVSYYGWNIWYGPATGRWWAMAPAWYGHVPGLLEAADPDTLASLIQQAEQTRPRFDDATRQGRTTVARRQQEQTDSGVGSAADGRWE
ncbi:hypothetical protein AB0K60_29275 [Thermopolyspora sp. NPDC052614]|uniref:hypothetical protein n=1 Tax=Thermopolyspora sp. NPDC052614 TaxID=3155682 RepID=UPI00342B65C9